MPPQASALARDSIRAAGVPRRPAAQRNLRTAVAAAPPPQTSFIYKTAISRFGPRLFVTSGAWVANDFAFYGNKLFQSSFIAALYPTVSSTIHLP